MSTKKMMKLAGLNTGIAILDVILFSPGLIGIELGGPSIFATALGSTAIFMSTAVFLYGNYKILTEQEKIIQTSEIITIEDYITALKQNSGKRTFEKDISIILEQIERIRKKTETIKSILLQKFTNTEMSFKKYEKALHDVENVFYINIKSILNKLNAFDEEEFNRVRKNDGTFSNDFVQAKLSIYNEYISFVKNAIEDNEEIILKLDKLLFEISNLNSLESGKIENMSEVKEIDDLTDQTKYYK